MMNIVLTADSQSWRGGSDSWVSSWSSPVCNLKMRGAGGAALCTYGVVVTTACILQYFNSTVCSVLDVADH
jgi:hypothetical protein